MIQESTPFFPDSQGNSKEKYVLSGGSPESHHKNGLQKASKFLNYTHLQYKSLVTEKFTTDLDIKKKYNENT